MFEFLNVSEYEKLNPFVDAITDKEILNGIGVTIAEGKVTPSKDATHVVMNIEVGDDMYMDEYKIPAGSHVRCLDLSAVDGLPVQIYGTPLPATFPGGTDKLKFKEDGTLESGAESETRFEITKIIGNKLGVEAIVKVKSGE